MDYMVICCCSGKYDFAQDKSYRLCVPCRGKALVLCYVSKAQLPLRLLCYDLSYLSTRVTGDLCTF